MNYDKAHDLAHAMRESEEYKELMAAQEALKAGVGTHIYGTTNAMGIRKVVWCTRS